MSLTAFTHIEEELNQTEVDNGSIVLSSFEVLLVKIKVMTRIFYLGFQLTGNPIRAVKLITACRSKFQKTFGNKLLTKLAKIENKYYYRLGTPAFPSLAWDQLLTNELSRFLPERTSYGLRTLLFAITKKCTLSCEHCFEWPNMNQHENLSEQDINQIVENFQDIGTTQIMFSGGEPMLRINDIFKVLEKAETGTDFWIITSGLGLDLQKAMKLKKAGLRGVMVSLDHHIPKEHDKFRGYENAFEMALNAVEVAKKAGLTTALALCATKSFLDRDEFPDYMKLAKKMGVVFVQVTEPRSSGRYAGKDVMLNSSQIEKLNHYFLDYNSNEILREFPIINYLGYHQRITGCFGAGNRFFYIDTDGDAHVCPYCIHKVCNVLENSAEGTLNKLSQSQCFEYEKSTI